MVKGYFAKWIIKHIDVWFAFARDLGLEINRMEDIILVTGRHLARSWTNVSFSESSSEEKVSFGVTTDTSGVNVEWHLLHEDVRGVPPHCGPSGQVRYSRFPVYTETVFSLTGLEFARESVHIRQRVPCHPILEDVTETSRRSGTNSGFRWK
jgi:hypothetical protein